MTTKSIAQRLADSAERMNRNEFYRSPELVELVREAAAEIARLQAQVVELAFLVQTAPTFFSAHSFDGEKLLWLKRAGLVPKDAK